MSKLSWALLLCVTCVIATNAKAASGPVLAVSTTHQGNFTAGRNGVYTISVSNLGDAPTAGDVYVQDYLPGILSLFTMTGDGWQCIYLTCSRSDSLPPGGGYPPIRLEVSTICSSAAVGINQTNVFGGGAPAAGTSDTTIVVQNGQPPDLSIRMTHTGSFSTGQVGATYTITVTNVGTGATGTPVTVADTLPTGMTAAAMSGAGWSCNVNTATCTRVDSLGPITSYPDIYLTVNVGGAAYPGVTNTAAVSVGGETNTANNTASDPTTVTQGVPGGLQFVPLTPCRVLDTRTAGQVIAGGSTRTIPVANLCGIPANAAAYALNATVVPRAGTLGYLTLWPAGQAQPPVSTLNSPDGSILANEALVHAGAGGAINAFALQDTDLVLDVNGYFAAPGAGTYQFYPLPPCRVIDTRNMAGPFGPPALSAGGMRSFPIASSGCGVPGAAAAYSFNVTVVPHGPLGYLTAWPTGQPQPGVSTLNSLDGTILANAAVVPSGSGGSVSFFATDTTDLVVDINGYFAPPSAGGLNWYAVNPCRLADTRNAAGSLGGPILSGNVPRAFPLPSSSCALPANAGAYSLNVTVVPSGALGYLTLWPVGQVQPGVSTLNANKGLPLANAAILPAGTGGAINAYALSTSHLVLDVNGYFAQ